MAITFKIDLSSSKAKAFLEYIKTLDFIKIDDQEDIKLSQSQKDAIDKGIHSLDRDLKTPHIQVMNQFKEKYPDYFTEE